MKILNKPNLGLSPNFNLSLLTSPPRKNRGWVRLFFLFLTPFALCFFISSPLSGADLTADQILEKIDDNMVIDQAVSVATMIIHSRSGSREIQSKSWSRGSDSAYVEYLKPSREKGKKMLKVGDKIYNYSPEPNDRIITISGHLLRQSVMGSDLSYEDMMENDEMQEDYTAEIIGKEDFEGNDCYVLELTAKQKDLAYYSRKMWVDSQRFLPLKEERFAKSGRLLKRTEIHDYMKVDNRWYPKHMTFKDMLSRGKGTEYIINSIDFNADIPKNLFTKAALRK
ncbi:MAG: outer membrane lipoprotein-sorting protein [Candidatus Marinimicrobia bacterium]|nr:outer membrane lipoprotein-sorting protein [Candidatus Neomarinimicrobiota bacterium]